MAVIDGLTSGVNVKLSFVDLATGNTIAFQPIFNFMWKEDSSIEKRVYIDGAIRTPKFFMGCSGSFELDRAGPILEEYYATQQALYLLGTDQVGMEIMQTIIEADGSVTQWQFVGAQIIIDDAGTYSGTEVVKQKVSFQSGERLPIS